MCTCKGNGFISRTQMDLIAISKKYIYKENIIEFFKKVIKVNDLFLTLSAGLSTIL